MHPSQLRTAVSPEAARGFFLQRRDVSLGLVPQALLAPEAADAWSLFWYAARLADDGLETGDLDPSSCVREIEGEATSPAGLAFAAFLASRPRDWSEPRLRAAAVAAVRALGREPKDGRPVEWSDYVRHVRRTSRYPLSVLHGLLLGTSEGRAAADVTDAFALSIQLGDDVRDREADESHARPRISQEEFQASRGNASLVDAWRWVAARALALEAWTLAHDLPSEATRPLGVEIGLWWRVLEAGPRATSATGDTWPLDPSLLAPGEGPLAFDAARRALRGTQPLDLGLPAPAQAVALIEDAWSRVPPLYRQGILEGRRAGGDEPAPF